MKIGDTFNCAELVAKYKFELAKAQDEIEQLKTTIAAATIHIREEAKINEELRMSLIKIREEVPKIHAEFYTESGGIYGTTNAPIKSVSMNDDGSLTVRLDYWPESNNKKGNT